MRIVILYSSKQAKDMDMSLASTLENFGIKPTQSRVKVADVLDNSTDHPDAETIVRRSKVSVASVYRILNTFENAGAIRAFDFFGDGRTRYEIDTGDDHGHVIKVKSGVIVDIDIKPFLDRAKKVAKETGGNLVGLKLLIEAA